VARKGSGIGGLVGRAASLVVALLAVLTLVASGASHELLHADERGQAAAVSASISQVATLQAKAVGKTTEHRGVAAHGCSGHCAAHAADQAPIPTLLPAPREAHADWRVEASASLRQLPTAGPERPPRA
jgi:hypothetical protein